MRLTNYLSDSGPRVVGRRGEDWIDVNRADSSLPSDMIALLETGETGLRKAVEAVQSGEPLADSQPKLLAPVLRPGKLFCIGLNYIDHAKESGVEPPPEPVVFNKFPSAIISPGEEIVLPRVSEKVDYEAELVAVIGRGGKHISEDDALSHVVGYCCGHDVSARDWQQEKPGKQWLLGKTFDTFAPLGPELVTADEVGDAGSLRIQMRLNGETMQDSSTSQLIFPIAKLVSYLSDVVALSPGDVIFTGTPPGVGAARKPPVFLQDGDVAEVEIEKLGVLKNPIVAES
ncbi:MAG: fumarylacetoacetate hydrolase family protein [Planctomycetales bacterium]